MPSATVGNDTDVVHVEGTNLGSSDLPSGADAAVWDAINVSYRMDGNHTIQDVELDIRPGATLAFTDGSYFKFESASQITLDGTAGEGQPDPILFTATNEQPGSWDGIHVETTDLLNTMEHVIVEYGGDELDANLDVASDFNDKGSVSIQNCTFRNAAGYGICAGGDADLPDTSKNLYTGNADGAARMRTDNLHYLSSTSDFSGNDTDIVQVEDANLGLDDLPPGEETAVWDAINVPYQMAGATHTIDDSNVELTVDPGAELQFEEQGRLKFDSNAQMTIEGTDTDPILLTGTEEIQGWWDGVYLDSDSLVNTIDHAIIEYGGRDIEGNVDVASDFNDDGDLTITDSTLRESAAWGLYVGDDETINSDACTVNDFENNAGGDCRVP